MIDLAEDERFIGWVLWEDGSNPSDLGEAITEILDGYSGPIIVTDVVSTKYSHRGLVFSKEIVGNDALIYLEQNFSTYEE